MTHGVRGIAAALVLIGNTVFWCAQLYAVALVKAIAKKHTSQVRLARTMAAIADGWVSVNWWILRRISGVRFHYDMPSGLLRDGWYMVVANHQSWADIMVLQCLFLPHLPLLRFFTKTAVIWVPFIGVACWALDFPFMRRYSREQIEARPELRGRDLEATRRACERFRDVPTSILNFLEGTRFTEDKHRDQHSPHAALLRPKTGGFAFVLSAMREQIETLIDVTIVYEHGAPTFWQFLCGRCPCVEISIVASKLPPEYTEIDYHGDTAERERFRDWVNDLWIRKDEKIAEMKARAGGHG